jgi:hypothetical protein
MSSLSASSEPQVELQVNSIFASKKKQAGMQETSTILPGNFHVSAKIDEESRRDNQLVMSYLLTMNDSVNLMTYEFRGACSIVGSSADFEALMATGKNNGSKLPKIVDIIYQRLYPSVFMLAGITAGSYPRLTALNDTVADLKQRDATQENPVPVTTASSEHGTDKAASSDGGKESDSSPASSTTGQNNVVPPIPTPTLTAPTSAAGTKTAAKETGPTLQGKP